ncbi:MAG: hypothetical protein QXY45_01310 [Candidatus Aenigmatarchaeota archaeon]
MSPRWSIGLLPNCSSPLELNVGRKPKITARDVGRNVYFIADPFLVQNEGRYYLFVEVKEGGKMVILVIFIVTMD